MHWGDPIRDPCWRFRRDVPDQRMEVRPPLSARDRGRERTDALTTEEVAA